MADPPHDVIAPSASCGLEAGSDQPRFARARSGLMPKALQRLIKPRVTPEPNPKAWSVYIRIRRTCRTCRTCRTLVTPSWAHRSLVVRTSSTTSTTSYLSWTTSAMSARANTVRSRSGTATLDLINPVFLALYPNQSRGDSSCGDSSYMRGLVAPPFSPPPSTAVPTNIASHHYANVSLQHHRPSPRPQADGA